MEKLDNRFFISAVFAAVEKNATAHADFRIL